MRKALLVLLVASAAGAAVPDGVRDFVALDAHTIALTHVRVIDGTGAPARADQTLVIEDGRIRAVGDAATTAVPAGAQVLDLTGKSVFPGLVGMHDHLFMTAIREQPIFLNQVSLSSTRLYLASGVTSIRTTGSLEPYADLNIKRLIDEGKMPGPKVHVTGPYLEGAGTQFPQMHELKDADSARRMVEFWADQGSTSFKAYMHITRAELRAAIAAAHKRGIKVTGHLCSIGYREAAELGIDNLEHGFFVASDFVADKKPDLCPDGVTAALGALDPDGPAARGLIKLLVARKVAITSTLPVFEAILPRRAVPQRVLSLLAPEAAVSALATKARLAASGLPPGFADAFEKDKVLERAFVRAGGVLLAGSDPTGIGTVLAGLADQREVELLVEAGFTPVEALHIATENGARFLGEDKKIGTVAAGKQADLVIVRGDPSTQIDDIENVEMVFKDGVGYDPAKLLDSVRGRVAIE